MGPAAILLLLLLGPNVGANCDPPTPDAPRTLILALDGVPYRVVQKAREQGAFEGWPETRPLVSTFPSMTNASFVEILEPFDARPIGGYEVRYYDAADNQIQKAKAYAWRENFQVMSSGTLAKAQIYMSPGSKSKKELRKVRELVLESPSELMLAHVAATDSLTHFRGDDRITGVLIHVSEQVREWRREHLERYGRPLHVVLLSDHGNTQGKKVRSKGGLKSLLKNAGLRPSKRLKGPDDVVPLTYGVVGYGALYLDPRHAETAARAVLDYPGMHFAAWVVDDGELRMLSPEGEASVHWREAASERRFAYDPGGVDPLQLSGIVQELKDGGKLDADGFASETDWFEASAAAEFPDAPRRLVDALEGTYVVNAATVIFSLNPGHAWGVGSARMGAWVLGGKLEATHGGLDRDATWGFFLASDSDRPNDGTPLRADRALAEWGGQSACLQAVIFDNPLHP
jgi:hypothetical protein